LSDLFRNGLTIIPSHSIFSLSFLSHIPLLTR
jgi:hypothetical protein